MLLCSRSHLLRFEDPFDDRTAPQDKRQTRKTEKKMHKKSCDKRMRLCRETSRRRPEGQEEMQMVKETGRERSRKKTEKKRSESERGLCKAQKI